MLDSQKGGKAYGVESRAGSSRHATAGRGSKQGMGSFQPGVKAGTLVHDLGRIL